MSNPIVKVTPTINKGQTVWCKSTGESFKVLEITKASLVCEGRAGVMPREMALTEKPAQQETQD